MATFIKLTHLVDNKPAPVFVNIDQICHIGGSVGGGATYQTNILLAQGQVDVRKSAVDVMQLIKSPNAGAIA
jgi:hypothetical protein